MALLHLVTLLVLQSAFGFDQQMGKTMIQVTADGASKPAVKDPIPATESLVEAAAHTSGKSMRSKLISQQDQAGEEERKIENDAKYMIEKNQRAIKSLETENAGQKYENEDKETTEEEKEEEEETEAEAEAEDRDKEEEDEEEEELEEEEEKDKGYKTKETGKKLGCSVLPGGKRWCYPKGAEFTRRNVKTCPNGKLCLPRCAKKGNKGPWCCCDRGRNWNEGCVQEGRFLKGKKWSYKKFKWIKNEMTCGEAYDKGWCDVPADPKGGLDPLGKSAKEKQSKLMQDHCAWTCHYCVWGNAWEKHIRPRWSKYYADR